MWCWPQQLPSRSSSWNSRSLEKTESRKPLRGRGLMLPSICRRFSDIPGIPTLNSGKTAVNARWRNVGSGFSEVDLARKYRNPSSRVDVSVTSFASQTWRPRTQLVRKQENQNKTRNIPDCSGIVRSCATARSSGVSSVVSSFIPNLPTKLPTYWRRHKTDKK